MREVHRIEGLGFCRIWGLRLDAFRAFGYVGFRVCLGCTAFRVLVYSIQDIGLCGSGTLGYSVWGLGAFLRHLHNTPKISRVFRIYEDVGEKALCPGNH